MAGAEGQGLVDSQQSAHWDQVWQRGALDEWDDLSEEIYQALVREIGDLKGKRILEAGSGSGRISRQLAQDGADVTLLDFSPIALQQAEERFLACGLKAQFLAGKIESIPVADGFYDVIWSAGVLEHYDEAGQIRQLEELHRVLKPGGLLIQLVPAADCLPYRLYMWYAEMTGTWQFGQETPQTSLRGPMSAVGLEGVREYHVAFRNACEQVATVPGAKELVPILRFWYQQLSPAEREQFGYLLLSVGRKPDSLPGNKAQREEAPGRAISADDDAAGLPEMVIISSIEWDYLWQRPQQLACQFSRLGYRTIYVESKVEAVTAPRKLTPPELASSLRSLVIKEARFDRNVAIAHPLIRLQEGDSSPREIVEPWLRALIQTHQLKRPIFWVLAPWWGPVAALLRQFGYVVYDCVDEHRGFSHADRAMVEGEQLLTRQADMVAVTGRKLLESRRRENRSVHLIPNGVTAEQFGVPRAKGERNHPVIGFVGALANWFDAELVATLARTRPGWDIVLVGPDLGADLKPLVGLSNVKLRGGVPYQQVPAVLAEFDVGIIPFQINSLTDHANPVKVYEYLAAGLPVVTTAFAEAAYFDGMVAVASSPQAFVALVEEALGRNQPEEMAARRNYAGHHSWQARAALGAGIADAYDQARRGDSMGGRHVLADLLARYGDEAGAAAEIMIAMAGVGGEADLIFLADGDAGMLQNLAQRLAERGKMEAAALLMHEAMQIEPDNPEIRLACAALQNVSGACGAALANLLILLSQHQEIRAIPQVARSLAGLGYGAEAQAWADLVERLQQGELADPTAELERLWGELEPIVIRLAEEDL